MSNTRKKIWSARADVRGGIDIALRDHAHVVSQTHTQWDVSALTYGVDDRLNITLDATDAAIVNLQNPGSSRTILDLNTLVADINNAFANGNPAFPFRGGRLLVRSYREGVGSHVSIGGDTAAKALLNFNTESTALGRSIEDAAYNVGGENNPPGTFFVAEGEQDLREVINRPSAWLATVMDSIQGYANTEYAIPKYTYPADPSEVLTMDELGAPRILTIDNWTNDPIVNEQVTGGISGETAYIYNIGPESTGFPSYRYLVIVEPSGEFTPGESITGGSSGLIGDAVATFKDDRVRAVKINDAVYVGSERTWGAPPPTPEQLSSLFNVTIRPQTGQEPGTHRNALVKSGEGIQASDPLGIGQGAPTFTKERPHRTGQRVRVSAICAGQPDNPYTPTRHTHQGIQRTSLIDVVSWTKRRIYPASVPINVKVGDILEVSNSQSVIGSVPLNNGRYCITAVEGVAGYYEVGPSRSGLWNPPYMPEDVLLDSEIYDENSPTTPQAKIQIFSPSYVLVSNQLDDGSVDRSCWIFLEEPIEAVFSEIWVNYYKVTNTPNEDVGLPELESPTAKYQRARIDDLERMLRTMNWGSVSQGKLQMGRWPNVNTYTRVVSTYAQYTDNYADVTARYDFVGPARELMYSKLSASREPSANPATPPVMAGVVMDEVPKPDSVHPVKNMMSRKVSGELLYLAYTTDNGTPPSAGLTLTGENSGALLKVRSVNTSTKAVYAIFLSGSAPLRMPEKLEWNAGADFIDGVTVGGYWGFCFDLPPDEGEAITATIAATYATTVTLSGTPNETDIRPGDLFQARSGPLYSIEFKSRVRSVTSPTILELEIGAPQGDAGFEFKITPDLADVIVLAGSTARTRKGSPFVQLDGLVGGLPSPYYHGIKIGDLLVIGAAGPLPIKRVLKPEGFPATPFPNKQLIEVEYGYEDFSNTTDDWYIISRHHRGTANTLSGLGNDSLPGYYEGAEIQQVTGSEMWYLKGPAYIEVELVEYHDTLNKGGIVGGTVPSWSSSGLAGKSMTFELYSAGDLRATHTIQFVTNPLRPEDLVSDINTLLGASTPWLSVQLSKTRPAVVFITVPVLTQGYSAVGPGVSLEITGDAWETMLAANESVNRGNMSRLVKPHAYHEQLRLVVEPPTYLASFDHLPLSNIEWTGIVDMVYPAAELSSDKAQSSWIPQAAIGTNILRALDPNIPVSTLHREIVQDGVLVPPFARPTLNLSSDKEWVYDAQNMSAFQVTLGQFVRGYMTHGGSMGAREFRPVTTELENLGRLDALDQLGAQPGWLYSGPIGFKLDSQGPPEGTWEGHVLSLIVEHGRQYFTPNIRFTASEDSLSTITAYIHSGLQSQVGLWLGCCIDQQGTGFVIFVDEDQLPSNQPPYFNNSFRLVVNHHKTTLHHPYVNDKFFSDPLGKPWAGPYMLAPHMFRGSTFGAVAGVVTDRGGGRRLIVPAHADNYNAHDTPLKEETWWEERPESLKQDMDLNRASSFIDTIATYQEGVDQPETLTLAGGPRPGPGKLFLYQFAGSGAGTEFDIGSFVHFKDGKGSAQTARVISQAKHDRPDNLGADETGLVVSLARIEAGEELHAGGTFIGDNSDITLATKLAFYNPVLLLVDSVVGTPPSKGDDIHCSVAGAGGAIGIFGGSFTVISDEYYIVYNSTSKWRDTDATYIRQDSWYAPTDELRSAAEPTFKAKILEAIFLDSNILDGGAPRPVVSFSYKGFSPYEKHLRKPAITAHGDFQTLEGGQYLYHERLPNSTFWPKESEPTVSGLLHGEVHPVGRSFCVELPAEAGHAVLPAYDPGVEKFYYTHPGDTYGMGLSTLIPLLRDYEPKIFDSLSAFDQETYWSFVPPAKPSPLWSPSEALYACVAFHVPIPDQVTAIEGFGAYIDHQLEDAAAAVRGPALIVMDVLTAQKKTNSYIHRLEVQNTFGPGHFMRVDSAGGGGRISGHSYTPPPWAKPTQWSPMPIIPLWGNRGKFFTLPAMESTLEIFLEGISETIMPAVGDVLYAANNPAPEDRQITVAYVEQYGLLTSSTAYRLFAHIGPTARDPQDGYPRKVSGTYEQVQPRDSIYHPWNLFHPGERLNWSVPLGASKGYGQVVKVNRYPHGNNVRIRAYIPAWKDAGGVAVTVDKLAGVYVRFRCDRSTQNRL